VDGVVRIPLDGQELSCDGEASDRRKAAVLRCFLAGPENRLVPTVATSVLNGDISWGPITFYGPSGVGKSLLVRGLARQYASRHADSNVLVLPANDICREFGRGFDGVETANFTRAHREADLLIVEDIDELNDRFLAQEELVRMLDAVGGRNGLVILTCRFSSFQFKQLIPPLSSRISSGLAIPIALPLQATRRALLLEWSQMLEIGFTKEALALLADESSFSAPRIRSALVSLAYGSHHKQQIPIDLEAVQNFLRKYHAENRLGLRVIAVTAARHFGLKLADLKSPSRQRAIVEARAVAMYISRRRTDRSLEQIGGYFGGRDHTTVLHNCRRTESLVKTDPTIQNAVAKLESTLFSRHACVTTSRGKNVKPLLRSQGNDAQPT